MIVFSSCILFIYFVSFNIFFNFCVFSGSFDLANLKQSIKRIRQNNKRRIINKINISIVRTYIKKFLKSLLVDNVSLAVESYRLASSKIDKSVTKGIFHKNKANRLKSRLFLKLKKLGM